jgi:putative methyltransferase (TIGR04325 family)
LSLFRRKSGNETIWRGIYRNFDDVPSRGSGHQSGDWIEALVQALVDVRQGEIHETVALEHEALLLTLRLLGDCRRVVDFGGGVGASYAYLRRVAPEIDLRYDVVEIPEVVEAGRKLWDSVHFTDSLGPEHHGADIVFVRSALQYLRDYSACLRSLFSLQARVVVMEKLSGVDGESYATAQVNIAGSSIPYWFISIPEILTLAANSGYRQLLWRRLPRVYDQSEFPPDRRMGQASTIILGRALR